MSFVNECFAIIRRSTKEMFFINLGNGGLYYNYYDSSNKIVHRDRLIMDNNIDFTKYSFSLDKNDNVYCIYCDDSLQILECRANSHIFVQKESITYNYKKFGINFPFVKYINGNPHIFYYVYNHNSSNVCALFHHYEHNGQWIENKIDFINHLVLDNFSVVFYDSIPTVFYFNLVNGCEELFASRFNLGTLTWSMPVKITNTGKNKIYLSVIKDSMNFYHICFCENIENGFIIRYLNGYLNENSFNLEYSTYLNSPSPCMYPSLLKHNNILYVSWVLNNRLYTINSTNSGKTWFSLSIDEDALDENFVRSSFLSNYKEDLGYNVSCIFTTIQDVGILGL